MSATAPTALLPALAAWATDTGLPASFAADASMRSPEMLLVTDDPAVESGIATGTSRPAGLAGTVDVDILAHVLPPVDTVGLTPQEVGDLRDSGVSLVDHAVDSGVPLLLLGGTGASGATEIAVSAVTATICRKEPVTVVHHGIGADVAVWRTTVTAVRDAMFRARDYRDGPWDAGSVREILRILGTPGLAVMVGVLTRAAARRTPVILDGADTLTAALLADAAVPGASRWWLVPHLPPAPAAHLAVERLGLSPMVDRDLGIGSGAGLVALPLLRIAVDCL
ncbi:nicotinate-nucleotide--dimethylbenzimidazole phosphoribosyltransferase [uncultured Corynebacterium sp.]|uniref:nicotinate-nucleotide--dimethylbenzimidazole phosphoribosyltransferase n=1 Tax=uncultured Corynebacterium sp. TaxID=159447 RepID=UPI0025CBDF93|nr:nicotinate-nucleotide--dimethylbenzimidazole phosphoribosyltransferase [uncultured Corynebacterium sp.]